MSVTIWLIGLFRDRGVVLTPECLSRMGRFISDAQGRVTFRSKWLDIRTRDPLKSWASAFFFVKNDWGLIEKWGKLTDLPAPLHIGEEDIMRILKVRYLGRYIEEEFLFKVGLSIHAGRSEAKMLKKSAKAPEPRLQPQLQLQRSPLRNREFVNVKYLQGEYKRKYDSRTKEVKVLEAELSECRTELANIAVITQLRKDQKASAEKVGKLEAENKRSRALLAEKEAALSGLESSRIIEDFKNSIAFKTLIQDHVQEARDHIYDIEVKALEQQCMDEGFIRGFLKGVRLMQRKTGVTVEGLTPSQASSDPSSDADGDEVESELQKGPVDTFIGLVEYILDAVDMNIVNCDDKLKRILLGKDQIKLAELPTLIKLHFPKQTK
ncbi:hypothetical protein M5K25_016067 [Dendrobium thyrsiflorum]|uniref:Uncharacterized protein n=1 Tax=Dendrobium thyrsiflorum TaxID=117978 RepID=A0ABD0URZ7_DENTH